MIDNDTLNNWSDVVNKGGSLNLPSDFLEEVIRLSRLGIWAEKTGVAYIERSHSHPPDFLPVGVIRCAACSVLLALPKDEK